MNDKKKSRRLNKKLGGILLIAVVCAICLNFLGMYVYKTAKKDSNYVNYEVSYIPSANDIPNEKARNSVLHNEAKAGGIQGSAASKERSRRKSSSDQKKRASAGNNLVLNNNSGWHIDAETTAITDVTATPYGDGALNGGVAGAYQSVKCPKGKTCSVKLSAKSNVPGTFVAWMENGKLVTNKDGSVLTGDYTTSYTNKDTRKIKPVLVEYDKNGYLKEVDSKHRTIRTTTTTPRWKPTNPSNGGGGGGNPTTKTSGHSNNDGKEVFAKDKEYSGESIKCGDKLYVTSCNNDADPVCQVTKINGKSVSNTFIKKSHYVENETDTGCYQNVTRYVKKDTYYYSDSDLSKDKKMFPCGNQVTLKRTMDVVCNDKSCEVEYDGKTIYLPKDSLITYKPTCSSDSDGTCNSSEKQTNVVGNVTIKICNKDDSVDNRDKYVTCATDYNKYYKMVNDQCGESTSATCYREYEYTCIFGKAPGISASAGILDAKGYGTINITGYDYGNVGLKGYYLSAGVSPTESSNWEPFDSNNKASQRQPAGTYFVWAKNNRDIMSNAVLVKVYDANLTTTMKSFGIVDDNTGNVLKLQQLDSQVANADQIVDGKYVLLSNKLLADSDNTGFDSLTTAYEVTTTSNKIALYATLTSEDAGYIPGYEPRTVDLIYGRNVVLVRIQNKDGRERVYTFIVNRVDDRSNDNTLKNIKLSRGKLEFNSYVTNYDVEIGKNVKKISINAELNDENASFVEGYEPRTIDINEDKQSAVIKVMSYAGNVRSYVITFTKKDYVEEPANSAYLNSLTIPGTQLSFDRDTYDYTITVPYETENLPIYAFAESENASVNISNNFGLEIGDNLVEIEVKNGKNSKLYSLHVIRKEYGLDVSDSAKLGTLSIKGYDINFDPNVLDYTVKIKKEKTLMIAATPESNRADIYMYGNNDLTGFSTVRIKVIAENGATEIYSIDIKKDAYNKKLEIIVASVGCLVIIISGIIIISKRKKNNKKEYMEG